MEQQFAMIRECLCHPPSARVWQQLMACFAQWPAGEEHHLAISYAEQHLAHWPDELRISHAIQTDHPGWPLVRNLKLSKNFRVFCSLSRVGKRFENITHISGNLGGSHLKNLGELPKLTHVGLFPKFHSASEMTSLNSLKSAQGITHLHLQIQRRNLAFLAELPKLQELRIIENALVRDLRVLHKLKQLLRLHIINCHRLNVQPSKSRMETPADLAAYLERLWER